jgi:hypothetical protein
LEIEMNACIEPSYENYVSAPTALSYIGTKLLRAAPMTRADYNAYRGWSLPANENGADDGYLVEYTDGGSSNHQNHKGYISWSPKAQFEAAYRRTNSLNFGLAIEALKMGKRVARAGWNGMWLLLVQGYDYNPDKGDAVLSALGCEKLPWIGMKTADCKIVPWLASQTDMLGDDWVILD